MKTRILIIEDDLDILELVEYNLEREGYEVLTARDGREGFSKVKSSTPDLVLLDLMLPGLDGLEICKMIRKDEELMDTPIIMLTAKSEESDIVIGLELGADDYMPKPFSPKQLVARVKSLLRRTQKNKSEARGDKIKEGPLEIYKDRHEVYLDGSPMSLTLAEYKLLVAIVSKPGVVFSREELLDSVSGKNTYVVDRNVDVHIRSIRKKFGDRAKHISTVRGVGYKWIG